MAEGLHTLAMIQQAESPEIGDKALGSQNMAYEVRRDARFSRQDGLRKEGFLSRVGST